MDGTPASLNSNNNNNVPPAAKKEKKSSGVKILFTAALVFGVLGAAYAYFKRNSPHKFTATVPTADQLRDMVGKITLNKVE